MSLSNNFPTIAPSLNLSFALTKALDPRVTFTRTTTATYYDGVTTSKAEENLLLQSQAWATSPWYNNAQGSGNVVVNNDDTAPDGTSTATSLTFGSTQFAARLQSVTTISGLNYTFSFWAKRVSGNTALTILHFDSATGGSTAFTITNDWVRYSVTVLGKSGGGNVAFGVQDANASGFGEILLWGGQVEQRASMTAYTPTTTQPITNYIPVLQTAASGVARFDHNPTTGESLGLLVEEQRTNLLTYSDDFANAAWTKTRSSITANTIVAPDGTLTGDKLVANTDSNTHNLQQNATVVASSTNTISVYMKAGEYTWGSITVNNGATFPTAYFNLTTGAAGSVSAGSSSTIQSVGNGWYRCTMTFTMASGTTATVFLLVAEGDNDQIFAGNGYSGIFIWGAQLEAGAFSTSYIKTTSATVTRNADVASMTGSNFTSWFNNAEGTLYGEGTSNATTGFRRLVAIVDNSPQNNVIQLIFNNASSAMTNNIRVNDVAQATFAGGSLSNKTALAYKLNDSNNAYNGVLNTADTSCLIPVVDRLCIGVSGGNSDFLNGTIKKLAYYPSRLTNAQLQALTS